MEAAKEQNGPDLRERILALLREQENCLASRRNEREREMAAWEERLARFTKMVSDWFENLVTPKLRTLVELFPNSEGPSEFPAERRVVVVFKETEAFPTEPRISVGISPDSDAVRARVTFRVAVMPILQGFDCEGALDLDLAHPDVTALDRFLDDRILRFVHDYLGTLQPESPYQRNLVVTDPVCGMELPRSEAAGTVRYGDRTYFFCVPSCQRESECDPERFLKPRPGRARP